MEKKENTLRLPARSGRGLGRKLENFQKAIYFFFFFFFSFVVVVVVVFSFFWAAPAAYGGSQGRG